MTGRLQPLRPTAFAGGCPLAGTGASPSCVPVRPQADRRPASFAIGVERDNQKPSVSGSRCADGGERGVAFDQSVMT
jgi:hypothetical protein